MRYRIKNYLRGMGAGTALVSALVLPNAASAGSLDDAFSNLTGSGAYSEGGAFETSTRMGYALPGMTMRFQTNTYTLVSVEPPSLEIGCNGIDAHLGSLTFLNGEQMEQMLEEISNSTAMLFLLALKNLCGPCGAALEWAEKIAEWANGRAIDTCEVSKSIVNGAMEIGQDMACSVIGTEYTNESDSFLNSKRKLCKEREDASKKTNEAIDNGTSGDVAEHINFVGNQTWAALQKAGIAPEKEGEGPSRAVGELFMSWMGTTIGDDGENTYPPKITDGAQFLNIFLCGSKQPSASDDGLNEAVVRSIRTYCKDTWGIINPSDDDTDDEIKLKAYKCKAHEGASDPVARCMELDEQNITDMDLGHGFITQVATVLQDAVRRAANNEKLLTEHKKLIAAAPFPLYQGINVASTHPAIGSQLVMSYSVILAHQMGIEYIKHIIQEAATHSQGSNLPGQIADAYAQSTERLVAATEQAIDNINLYSEVHSTFMQVVSRIQQQMVRDARSSGISGFDFAADLAAIEEKGGAGE